MTPRTIMEFGSSERLIDKLIRITNTGMSEQMMAAMPLSTKTSAQDTRPLLNVIIRKPMIAISTKYLTSGSFDFWVIRTIADKSRPALIWRIAANRKGGKS